MVKLLTRGWLGASGQYYATAEDAQASLAARKLVKQKVASLVLSSVIKPLEKTSEGIRIEFTAAVWFEIVRLLEQDWSIAFQIPPRKWEEIIAGAYHNAGFDEITLTPRSNDFGRDVIAVKHGVGAIRVLGSMKAYGPDHLVPREHVHEMLGVVTADPGASKGIISTTSDFAPRLLDDQNLKRYVPYKLELMNGSSLQKWLSELVIMKKRQF